MTSLQNCIDWNTNAVALTMAGRKDEAVSTIKKSLKVLETLFNASKQGCDIPELSADNASTSTQGSQSPIVSVPILNVQEDTINSPSNLSRVGISSHKPNELPSRDAGRLCMQRCVDKNCRSDRTTKLKCL